MSWSQWALFALIAALRVAGQSSNVTQCVPDYTWSINAKGQTPCLVASYLESQCGTLFTVDSIPNGTHYLGPTFATQSDCFCNTVTYSMISACGGCQGRNFQNWTTWSQFCIKKVVGSYPLPLPSIVEVPKWAFINVTLTANNFNPAIAQAVLAGNPPPSGIITSSTPSSTSSPTSSDVPTNSAGVSGTASSDNQNGSSKSHSNAGAIVGGVIGVLVVIVIIGLFFLWRHVKAKRNTMAKDLTFDSTALVSGPGNVMSHTTGGTMLSSQSAPVLPASMIGPYGTPSIYTSHYGSEMGTVPPTTPATTGVYTSLSPGPTRRSLESVSPSMVQLGGYQAPNYQGGYRGTAEVS